MKNDAAGAAMKNDAAGAAMKNDSGAVIRDFIIHRREAASSFMFVGARI